uniref:Xylulose kinase-1 n=1 Tax=Tanacetum cinerariifolium TaxID=118510 RepID=A0A699KM89_TANCI|nr:hypothetical protein [Tanacetum cinerariifolium]
MARLAFCDYHNMITILEKYEHNQDFHQIADFVEASHIRYALTYNHIVHVFHIRQFWSTARIETTKEGTKILATVDGKLRTVSESSIRRNLKLNDEAGIRTPTEPHHTPTSEASQSSQHELPSPSLPPVTTESLPTVIPSDTTQLRQYTRRARIAQSSVLPHVADEPDRANITKTSTLPSDSTPRVTSLDADEGSMQQKLDELTALCTGLQRQQSEMVSKFAAKDLKISQLKARVRLLEDRKRGGIAQSEKDAPIKGRSLDEKEAVAAERSTERGSDDTDEMVNVLTSLDAAKILTSGGVQVSIFPAAEFATATVSIPTVSIPTGSGSIPTASPIVPTSSDVVPTASPIFTTTTTESTPYTRRKGKEKMVESDTPKKKKLQEQIDVHVARELKEEMAKDAQKMNRSPGMQRLHEYMLKRNCR